MKTIDEILKNYEKIYHEYSAGTVIPIEDVYQAMKEYTEKAITEFMNKSEEWLHCYGGDIDYKWIEKFKESLK